MYSGEDSSGDPLGGTNQFLNWAMGQNSFAVNKDQVDWAALAQQWIMMKESCSNYVNTNVVNNTSITPQHITISNNYEEKGEAPMEVVKEDEILPTTTSTIQGSCINPTGVFVPEPQQVWQPGWCQPNQSQLCGNWTTWDDSTSNPLQVPSIQPINVFKDKPNVVPSVKNGILDPLKTPQMDAAKKKTLPAWIREGLEKMEREKQKQLEKLKKESTVQYDESNKTEEDVKDILKTENLLQDSEQSDVEDNNGKDLKVDVNIPKSVPVKVEKSREEIIEETMLVVRKSLTELLLEVTSEEIVNVAQECLKRYKTKGSISIIYFRQIEKKTKHNKN